MISNITQITYKIREEKQPRVPNALFHYRKPMNPPPLLRLKTDVIIKAGGFKARIQLAFESRATAEVKKKQTQQQKSI